MVRGKGGIAVRGKDGTEIREKGGRGVRVRIQLYGCLRDAGQGEEIELQVPEGTWAGKILQILAQQLQEKREILQGAVLASGTQVLRRTDPIPMDETLAVLPPVCGG